MSQAIAGKNYLNESSGLWSWLTTLDHKRIGIMYFITVMFFFLIGGIMALLLRLELFSNNNPFIDSAYGVMFSCGTSYPGSSVQIISFVEELIKEEEIM